MLIPFISLLFLAIAAYFLIRTKPNLFLFDLMKEVCGEAYNEHGRGRWEISEWEPLRHGYHW